MRIIALKTRFGGLYTCPIPGDGRPCTTYLARIYADSKGPGGIGRDFLGHGDGTPPPVYYLAHGEAVEWGRTNEDKTKQRWWGVLLAPDPVPHTGEAVARFVECATADDALRLAWAIQTGDKRAAAYLPGGKANAPDLELPRELPPFDLARFPRLQGLQRPRGISYTGDHHPAYATWPGGDDYMELLEVPERAMNGHGKTFIGCINEDQLRAVHGRARAAGLTKEELADLCRVRFKVPEPAQLRRHMFREMMDVVLPAEALARGLGDVSSYKPPDPMDAARREFRRHDQRKRHP